MFEDSSDFLYFVLDSVQYFLWVFYPRGAITTYFLFVFSN